MKEQKMMFVLGLLMVGLLTAVSAAVLLVIDVIESGVAAVIGIVGIGLIATSSILIQFTSQRKPRW